MTKIRRGRRRRRKTTSNFQISNIECGNSIYLLDWKKSWRKRLENMKRKRKNIWQVSNKKVIHRYHLNLYLSNLCRWGIQGKSGRIHWSNQTTGIWSTRSIEVEIGINTFDLMWDREEVEDCHLLKTSQRTHWKSWPN